MEVAIVVLVLLAASLVVLLFGRVGRAVARAGLVLGGLVLGVLLLAVLGGATAAQYQTARAATEAAQAAQVASLGTLAGAVCVGGLGAVTVAAIGAAGWFYLRYRAAVGGWPSVLPHRAARRGLPGRGPVVYVLDDIEGGFDFEEVYEWASDWRF